MREIEFRGKTPEGKWIYGGISINYDRAWIDQCFIDREWFGDTFVDKDTIGQYTGMKDKNGVKIYEGDIVYCQTKFGKAKAIIEFINGKFVAHFDSAVTHPKNGHYISYYDINKRFEVIGNKFDNPELLKERD